MQVQKSSLILPTSTKPVSLVLFLLSSCQVDLVVAATLYTMPGKCVEDKVGYRIAICGAGFAGLCTAIQLQLQLGVDDYTIFEENEEVGGTWLLNTYPGCACDVPTYFYSYSFEENPNWSKVYCSQQEILEYLKNVANKHDIYKKIKFGHQVMKVRWDEDNSCTRLSAKNREGLLEEYVFDIVIYCNGGLRNPNIPEEFDAFKGPKIHSAKWDHNVALEGKNVAVVGTGASAVQIIPEIVKQVKKLSVFQRNPPWVIPRPQFNIPLWLQWIFANVPGAQKAVRFLCFWILQIFHFACKKDSPIGKIMEAFGKLYLRLEFTKDSKIREQLIPKYRFGVKRPIPSSSYYNALNQPHVKVITSKITEVKSHSIVTEDGQEECIDVLILATGFRVLDYAYPMQAFGKGNVDIRKLALTKGPSGYKGICNSKAPNSFAILGANGPPGTTSFIFSVECAVNYVMQVIKEMKRRGCRVVTVDEEVEKAHMKKILEDMERMVWSYDYPSWYRDHRGVVIAMCPYSGLRFWKDMLKPNFDHFIFE